MKYIGVHCCTITCTEDAPCIMVDFQIVYEENNYSVNRDRKQTKLQSKYRFGSSLCTFTHVFCNTNIDILSNPWCYGPTFQVTLHRLVFLTYTQFSHLETIFLPH